MNFATAVPLVDLSLPEAEAATILHDACKEYGFLYVTSHGIPQDLTNEHFEMQRTFFSLPFEQKMQIAVDQNNRGYTPMCEETLDPQHSRAPDTHEGIYYGREVPAGSQEAKQPLHGPNQWPPEDLIPGYRAVVERYFEAVTALGMRLLRLLAISLGLPGTYFLPMFSRPMLALRPLHYSAVVSDPGEGRYASGAHTDYGMLTLLLTDDVPGLQIWLGEKGEGGKGCWVDVPPLEGAFIVNLGDMLERWTNGLYRSTLHRVVNTSGRERFSVPFFFEPNFDTQVEPLPQCCSADRPPRYPPTTSGQHLLDKYAATHTLFAANSRRDDKIREGMEARGSRALR